MASRLRLLEYGKRVWMRLAIASPRAYAGTSPRVPGLHYKLRRDLERTRISGDGKLEDLVRLLETPYSPALRAYEVSREVNRATVDTPELINPVSNKDGEVPPLFKAAKV